MEEEGEGERVEEGEGEEEGEEGKSKDTGGVEARKQKTCKWLKKQWEARTR